jgi:hypothetical protein
VKDISLHQTIIAVAALIGITALAVVGVVDGQVVVAIYSLVLGGALGYVNGKKAGTNGS